MITREEIIKAMQAKGIEAEATTVSKNNVTLNGIIIKMGTISPVIYTDEIIKKTNDCGWTIAEVVDRIMEDLETHTPGFDLNNILNPEYIKDHIKIGLQRATNEDIIKRPCQIDDAMECYLYIAINAPDQAAAAKLEPGMIDTLNIDLDTLWSRAELNTIANTDIFGFSEFLGMPAAEDIMYVVTNKDRVKGAGNILDKKALANFASSHGCEKLYAIPSSIHEWIIMPYSDSYNINALTDLVKEINAAEVDPLDQLGDKAYILTV